MSSTRLSETLGTVVAGSPVGAPTTRRENLRIAPSLLSNGRTDQDWTRRTSVPAASAAAASPLPCDPSRRCSPTPRRGRRAASAMTVEIARRGNSAHLHPQGGGSAVSTASAASSSRRFPNAGLGRHQPHDPRRRRLDRRSRLPSRPSDACRRASRRRRPGRVRSTVTRMVDGYIALHPDRGDLRNRRDTLRRGGGVDPKQRLTVENCRASRISSAVTATFPETSMRPNRQQRSEVRRSQPIPTDAATTASGATITHVRLATRLGARARRPARSPRAGDSIRDVRVRRARRRHVRCSPAGESTAPRTTLVLGPLSAATGRRAQSVEDLDRRASSRHRHPS